MFDFNGDGHTDSGEQFIGYQIFKDTTKGMNSRPQTGKIDGWDLVLIILIALEILDLLCGGH